jgi:hypothetical protein
VARYAQCRIVVQPIHKLVARAIKTQVEWFSERALCSGDDSLHRRECAFRCGVARTAQAIAREFHAEHAPFDIAGFATACGLYVSDGRDTYSDCLPGQLTWERPRDMVGAGNAAPAPAPEQYVSDSELVDLLPEYLGWSAAYEYPGSIQYAHPCLPNTIAGTSVERSASPGILI